MAKSTKKQKQRSKSNKKSEKPKAARRPASASRGRKPVVARKAAARKPGAARRKPAQARKAAGARKPAPARKAAAARKPGPARKPAQVRKPVERKASERKGADRKSVEREHLKMAKPASLAGRDEGRSAVAASKRKLGLRGAAPWAARHAAKHAAEARARAAEPAPPGSARATIRVPSGAEEIKAKVSELHNQMLRIRNLRKRLDKGFYEIGQVLAEIQSQELYLAKGYGSFEAFLEREIDLGKQTSLKLMKLAHIFQQDPAIDYGMERLFAALSALEGEGVLAKAQTPSSPGSAAPLPLKPPMRIVG